MKNLSRFRLWVPAALLAVITCVAPGRLPAQENPTQSLLEKAHALEVRGRMDMASQTWQQVLLADPGNTEALAGLARAAKLAGNLSQANAYLDKLRSINPNDPNIARIQSMGTQQSQLAQLQQAGKLAAGGQYAQAMSIYRQVFGNSPPPGDWALAFYETESATDEGRSHAISGLRGLVDKYPTDTRYQVALGRILTYNPKTRPEGRRLLERHPKDPQAVEALRQSLLWDSQNPDSAPDIRAYLAVHPDPQLAQALKNQPPAPKTPRGGNLRIGSNTPLGPEAQQRAQERTQERTQAARAQSIEEQAAYRALNAHHLEEAEQRFKAILTVHPESGPALAGMGYVRMQQANFGGAMSFLTQAKQDGTDDPGLENALTTARFWYTMGEGQAALNENDLATAEKQYRNALSMRPASPEALEGLGGTLLKAQQPAAAVQLFERFLHARPAAPSAWRGLFMAQYSAGNPSAALLTERRIPAAIHTQLLHDPDFLRTLASAYSAVGNDADAQRVLRGALELPFPAGAQGVKAETQLQYASLLQQANHLDQAGGLYRQVLATDPGNTNAWQGLVRVEHGMAQDPLAIQTIESMPPNVYAEAMRDPGFETTAAAIYQSQGKVDIAQDLLEKSLAQQSTSGQKLSAPVQIQLAGIYLQRNNPKAAYPIYQRVLSEQPARLDAWKGLLSALHTNGRDQEALAQVQQIPPSVRTELENDPEYLQTIAAVYNALGQPRQAGVFLARVQQYYTLHHSAPPADIEIQNGWLLLNAGNSDQALYRQLMLLGSRTDLTEEQRRTIQTQWASWAVRRANQAATSGDSKKSLAILNAAARAFPDNPGVIKALAGGYARAGLPRQAVAIFKAQDMTHTTASDYKAAVGAALAAGDTKDAETWLRYGLDAYPRDAQMLILGAKFEQARGDNNRAAIYYRASLAAMPPPDPGAELADELSRPVPSSDIRLPSNTQSQDLATLLAPGAPDSNPAAISGSDATPQTAPQSAYLPSYSNAYGSAPVQLTSPGAPVVPSYMANPSAIPSASRPAAPARLKDYVPTSSNHRPSTLDDFVLPSSMEPVPAQTAQAAWLRTLTTREMALAELNHRAIPEAQAAPSSYAAQGIPRAEFAPRQAPHTDPYQQAANQSPPGQPEIVYGPYVPYVPPAAASSAGIAVPVDHGNRATLRAAQQPSETTDVLPTARYVPNSRVRGAASNRPELAAARAAAVRRNQSNPAMGQSTPPPDDLSLSSTDAQYVSQPYNAAQGQSDQVTRPAARPYAPGTTNLPANPPTRAVAPPMTGQSSPPQSVSDQRTSNLGAPIQTGDSVAQQYPQPKRRTVTTARHTPPRDRRVRRLPTPQAASTTDTPTQQLPGMSYPSVAQPLTDQPYPAVGQPYTLPAAPTDAQLAAKNVPPLRGNYDPQVPLRPATHTEREQAELDLATLEASYSGWIGGTGYARYRSGTVGFDRLTDLEAPIELSAVLARNVRATIVPRPVFLSSGTIDTASFSGVTGTVPILGTFPANALTAPSQQFSSGIGGEAQLTTTNFGIAAGYTPYEFLVHNITGRARWTPAGGHFTFLFDRDTVKETQLSYSGLRDPGSATTVYSGNIWGGVVSTGGGLRFDLGSEKSGFYVSAAGATLNGYHVLDNTTLNGSAGAYFRVKVWPEYGSLNVGGSLYGAHFQHNERGLTYGQGGYFSPSAYFLASLPVTFTGHYKADFHYVVAGSIGLQTFQEDVAPYYPLDTSLQVGALSGCSLAAITARTCGYMPLNSNTGANYGINAEGSYRIADHWYAGGFFAGNNTNNYNTISGGFFLRYLFRPQFPTENYPTGLFPLEGFRPLKVP